jgi:dolichol-phosphate mannosyltransferase
MARASGEPSTPGWGRVVVIMPTYNEIDSLARVAGHLLQTVPGVDLLVVDDHSPDGTGALADRLAAENPRAHVLHRSTREGLGPAYLAGFAWARDAGYDIVVEMDADGSHPAETLPVMLDALGAVPRPGLVIGSRWMPGGSVVNWPRSRLLLSRTANLYARLALRMSTRDITAGYRAYPIDVVTAISSDVSSHGYSFQIEMALRVFDLGLPIVEVPIVFREREAGSSKMSSSIVREAMIGVTRWGWQRRFGGSRDTARARAARSS